MNPGLSGSPFAFLARRKPPNNANNVPMRTAGERNVRPPVCVYPQDAPDPIRQGDVPARDAHMPIVLFRFDEPYQEDQFMTANLEAEFARKYPQGRQTPFTPRANISVPPHVAYGSMFTADSTYVYG